MNPEELFIQARQKAAAIIKRSDDTGRPLTDAEIVEATKHLDEADRLKKHIDAANRAKGLMGDLLGGDADLDFSRLTNVPAIRGKSFKAAAGAAFSDAAVAHMKRQVIARGEHDAKAVIGTTLSLPPVLSNIENLPRNRTTVLELIPVVNDRNRGEVNVDDDGALTDVIVLPNGEGMGNSFGYIYQSARDNNAASVKDGAQKPTSAYGWDERFDTYRVFAHISEKLPERFLEDYGTIASIMADEMAFGLLEAIEAAVINGDDSNAANDDFDGILRRSGVHTVAAGETLVDTLSAGLFALTSTNETPDAWVMHPADYQRLRMLKEPSTGALYFGTGRTSIEQILGDLKVVTSPGLAVGTVLLGDFSKLRLHIRSGTRLRIYQAGEDVEHNEFKFRAENRVGLEVRRASAFAKITLPADDEPEE